MESNLFRAEFYKVIILFPIAIINKIEKLLIRQIFNNYNKRIILFYNDNEE